MLLPSSLSSYGFAFDNWGANPSSTPGLSVVPGASNVEGSFTGHILATGAQLTQDCYWLQLIVSGGFTSANQKDHLLDIGVDPAGGTAYTAVISNIVCGQSGDIAGVPTPFVFPLFIKAGSQVAVRIQGSNATAGTVRVSAKFLGQPSRPEAVPIGMFSETIGTITNSTGVAFTPGNAADGTWVSLGTTVKPMWWWQLCYQSSSATVTAERCYIDLGWGDVTNKKIIIRSMRAGQANESSHPFLNGNEFFASCYQPVPAGGELWVRGRCENAPDAGYSAVAVGIGG